MALDMYQIAAYNVDKWISSESDIQNLHIP